jgi:peptidyl-prolyl cis-trans isomerase A (cyclophilin A)
MGGFAKGGHMSKVRMETTKGTIVIDMFEDDAPETVKNFLSLVQGTKEWTDPKTGEKKKTPFYDGLRFHRVISNFMIQGGDPLTRHDDMQARWGTGGPGFRIKDELDGKKQKHVRGTLSMAHAGPGTGGSQFFICHSPQPHLDRKHTVFGQVVEGLDVVDKIRAGDGMVKVTVEQ